MPGLPTGTVTFLFTDVEGSTTLLQRLGDRRYAEVLAEHQRLLRDAFVEGHGQEVDTGTLERPIEGDEGSGGVRMRRVLSRQISTAPGIPSKGGTGWAM